MSRSGALAKTFRVLGALLMIVIGAVYLSPLLSTILAAMRTDADLMRNGIFAPPRPFFLGGFARVWQEGNLGRYFRNSIIVTVGATSATLLCASLAAYAIARFSFRLKTAVLLGFMAGMFFPPQVFIIPIYFFANRLHLYDTYVGLMLVHLAYQLPFSVLLLRGFFKTIPSGLLDAARIDGAGEMRILLRIILPLAVPSLGALSILLFTWIWNDYFWALSMSHSIKAQTIMIGIAAFRGRLVYNWNSEAASSLLSMVPPVVMFFAFQKFFIKGIRMGGVK